MWGYRNWEIENNEKNVVITDTLGDPKWLSATVCSDQMFGSQFPVIRIAFVDLRTLKF